MRWNFEGQSMRWKVFFWKEKLFHARKWNKNQSQKSNYDSKYFSRQRTTSKPLIKLQQAFFHQFLNELMHSTQANWSKPECSTWAAENFSTRRFFKMTGESTQQARTIGSDFLLPSCAVVEIKPEDSLEIDSYTDLNVARTLFKARAEGKWLERARISDVEFVQPWRKKSSSSGDFTDAINEKFGCCVMSESEP